MTTAEGSSEKFEESHSATEQSTAKEVTTSSLADYVPTPFAQDSWERVGEAIEMFTFSPLALDIIPGAAAQLATGTLFQDFSGAKRPGSGRRLHGGQYIPDAEGDLAGQFPASPEILKASFDEGYAAGVEKGREAARKEFDVEREALIKRNAELARAIDTEFKKFCGETEKQALSLALSVAKKILSLSAEVKPEYISEIIAKGMKSLGASAPLRIRVSPDDFAFIESAGLPEGLSAADLGVTYVVDKSIHSGCVIETDFGEADLQLDTMWDQVRERLTAVVK